MLESLLNKVAGLKACNFIKKRLQHRFFPLIVTKFIRTASFIEQLWWLLQVRRVFRSLSIIYDGMFCKKHGYIFYMIVSCTAPKFLVSPLTWNYVGSNYFKVNLKLFAKIYIITIFSWTKRKICPLNGFCSCSNESTIIFDKTPI